MHIWLSYCSYYPVLRLTCLLCVDQRLFDTCLMYLGLKSFKMSHGFFHYMVSHIARCARFECKMYFLKRTFNVTGVTNVIKCLDKVKPSASLHTQATYSNQPSDIISSKYPLFVNISKYFRKECKKIYL